MSYFYLIRYLGYFSLPMFVPDNDGWVLMLMIVDKEGGTAVEHPPD